jgi:hypothetical protein
MLTAQGGDPVAKEKSYVDVFLGTIEDSRPPNYEMREAMLRVLARPDLSAEERKEYEDALARIDVRQP